MPRRLLARQAEVLHGLFGIPTATVMMRQLAVVVIEDCSVEPFNGLGSLLVQEFASFLEHRAIRHVLGQGMLKEVLHFRKRRLFVEKLFALERSKEAVQFI